MSEPAHRNIRMHVPELGAGPPVVLCHGFPELWYSWRHQLAVLAAAGFRAMRRTCEDTARPMRRRKSTATRCCTTSGTCSACSMRSVSSERSSPDTTGVPH